MNYLVTHYKNLAEQLQSRINHIQQCLYEMDAAAGGGIDQLRVSDMEQANFNDYSTNSAMSTNVNGSTPTYPTVKGPFREKSDVNPSRWGLRLGPNGRPIPPVPVTLAWRRAVAAYDAAVRAYEGYQRSQTGQGIYKPRDPRDR
jgi:hypothetical protein